MADRFSSSQDGGRLTVADYLKSPTRVRNVVLNMMDQQFIADALLRKGPAADSGAVVYREAEPLFADDDASIVGEYGEIPAAETTRGTPRALYTVKRGLAVKISEEMRTRNDTGLLQDEMRKVRNTMVRAWDRVFMNAILTNPDVNTVASDGWVDGGTTAPSIRGDIAEARFQIQSAYYGDDEDNKFGYDPDVLILNPATANNFLDSDEVNKVFAGGNIADENLRYTGKMPRKFFGLNVLQSWQVPESTAIVMQRNMAGFISDERPLRGTPLYEDKPRETWRSDFTRASAVGVDNPGAITLIEGVDQTTA